MSEPPAKEPFVGEELIRILIEPHEVHFVFSATALQLGARFSIASERHLLAQFDPTERKGDLTALWGLIGRRVIRIVWGDHITLFFESGDEIRIGPALGQIRGSILGRNKVDDRIIFEDF